MNVSAAERKVFNKIKYLQIPEDEITADNFGIAAFRAGQYDMAKFLMQLRNGELSDQQFNIELAKLEPMRMVN